MGLGRVVDSYNPIMSHKKNETVVVTRRFELRSPIGEGAIGTVFTTSEAERGPAVAVKRLKPEPAADTRERERFHREAVITSLVDHPGVVAVYGLGETEEGLPFYAMQQIEGGTLCDLLRERGPRVSDRIWMDRLLEVFADICNTVAYAHDRQIVHRDLKPENILIGDDGTVLVADWGIARDLSDQGVDVDEEGLIIGTPGYMAPEQARGDSAIAGPPADVFALGIILYEILIGETPFRGKTFDESISRVLNKPAEDPRRLNRWVSKSLGAICTHALELDPYRRYANAGELANDLRAYREGRPVSVTRQSLPERRRGFVRRRPAAAALIGGSSLALFLILAWFAVRVGIEQGIAARDIQAVHVIDQRVSTLHQRTAEVEAAIETAAARGASRNELAALTRDRQSLVVRQLMLRVEELIMVRDASRLQAFLGAKRFEREAWSRIYGTIDIALETRHPMVAIGIIDAIRELDAEGQLQLALTAGDREKLQSLERRANEDLATLETSF